MKIWAYVILASILIGAVTMGTRAIYSAGYNKRDVEIRDDAIRAQNEAIDKGIADWVETQEQAETVIETVEVIREVIREIETKIPVVVEKIVTVTPECADLGDEFAGLLNEQIRASNSDQIPDPNTAPGMAEGVSGT